MSLSGRPMPPASAASAQSLSARGDPIFTHHGPFQALLDRFDLTNELVEVGRIQVCIPVVLSTQLQGRESVLVCGQRIGLTVALRRAERGLASEGTPACEAMTGRRLERLVSSHPTCLTKFWISVADSLGLACNRKCGPSMSTTQPACASRKKYSPALRGTRRSSVARM
jgi:hypothetical protein